MDLIRRKSIFATLKTKYCQAIGQLARDSVLIVFQLATVPSIRQTVNQKETGCNRIEPTVWRRQSASRETARQSKQFAVNNKYQRSIAIAPHHRLFRGRLDPTSKVWRVHHVALSEIESLTGQTALHCNVNCLLIAPNLDYFILIASV